MSAVSSRQYAQVAKDVGGTHNGRLHRCRGGATSLAWLGSGLRSELDGDEVHDLDAVRIHLTRPRTISAHPSISQRLTRTDRRDPAAHNPLDHLVLWQRVLVPHQRERRQTPVDTIHTQVFRHVIRHLVPFLPQEGA